SPPPKHGPAEGPVPAVGRSWMEMVGNRRERETRLFRGTCEMHEILRALFLRGKREADLHPAVSVLSPCPKVVPTRRSPKRLRRFVLETMGVVPLLVGVWMRERRGSPTHLASGRVVTG